MAGSNRYVDMSAKEALKLANERFLLLPDIQREYVWSMSDIEKMFESIVAGYPIGSCIFWKTSQKVINDEKPNLYYFLRDVEKDKSKNVKAPEYFGESGDYYVVLDGQQRITSLNIALYGSYSKYRGGRGYRWDNPDNWPCRELYYNLDFYSQDVDEERDDENPPKKFCFLTNDEAAKGKFFKVKQIVAFSDEDAFQEHLFRSDYEPKVRTDLRNLYKRINSSGDNGLIHYYCISENSYDVALDIFVRVNSTGVKLSKSDLLFSTLIDGWKEGKENIDKLLQTVNGLGDGFSFTRDYLMRLLLVLVDAPTNLRIESFDQKTVQLIRDNWKGLSSAFTRMVECLVSVGMSKGFISSYNATMPIVYYMYHGGVVKTDEDKNELRKFLAIAMAKRLFGVASNDALKKTREALSEHDCRKEKFSLSLFDSVILTGNRTFHVDEAEMDHWLNDYTIGMDTYVILTLLYPNLKLNQVSFHQDHCHPFAGFDTRALRNIGLDDLKIQEWQYKRNLLPNLQFLEGSENESKNKTPLKEWLLQDPRHAVKYMPSGTSLELEDFESFFIERRRLMKDELLRVFNVDNKRGDES